MLRIAAVALLMLVCTTPVLAAEPPQPPDEKTLYTIGLLVSRSLTVFNLTPAELEVVKRGITDGTLKKKPEVELNAYYDKVQDLARARRKAQAEQGSAANAEFLAKAAKEQGATKTASGLIFVPEKEGSGKSPGPTDTVKVHYRGTLADGKEFDSSYKRGTPAEFRLDGVIKCWTEGLQMMKPGGKARLFCPPALAYGDAGAGDLILPGSALEFEVELLEARPNT